MISGIDLVYKRKYQRKAVGGKTKTQASLEYLSTFTAGLIVLIIVIGIVAILLLNSGTSTSTYTPSSCYVSPEIDCQQIAVATNGISTSAVVIFTNDLGLTMAFPANAIAIYPTYSHSTSYIGMCLPANALPGATVICNVTMAGYNPSPGTQLNPSFQLTYEQCERSACGSAPATYNSVGTGTLYVSSGVSFLYRVQLLTNPASGQITLNGVPYPSNTFVEFVKGATYSIYADAPAANAFSSWTSSGGAVVNNPSSQGAGAYATSNGAIIANFLPVATTSSSSTTISGPHLAVILSPLSNTVVQGTSAPIYSFLSGGVAPYKYQWLAKIPGQTTFTSSEANTILGIGVSSGEAQSATALFTTIISTTAGKYYFELNVTDSSGFTATSGPSLINLISSGATSEFYCVGGEPNIYTNAVSSVWQGTIQSNPALITWTQSPNSYPSDGYSGVVDHSCAVSDGTIYCAGGDDNEGDYWNSAYYATVSGSSIGSWTQTSAPYGGAAESRGISDFSCVADGGYIYCISGSTVNSGLNTQDVWSAKATGGDITQWNQQLDYPLTGGVSGHICTAYNGYIYCVDGDNHNGGYHKVTNVEVATVSGGVVSSWTTSPNYYANDPASNNNDALTGLDCTTATVSSGTYLYCIGGDNNNACPSADVSDVWYAPISGTSVGTWTQATSYGGPSSTTALDSLSCVVNNGAIYCTAGGDEACGAGPTISNTYYATINPDGSLGNWNSATPFGSGSGLLDLECSNS